MSRVPYIGTKMIDARPGFDPKGDGTQEGYDVWYTNPDGSEYKSWSPKDVFEASYRMVTGMSFGMAIEALKLGLRVGRDGWNGKGMFLLLVDTDYYSLMGSSSNEFTEDKIDNTVKTDKFIGMYTAGNTFQPGWLASQADLLANDWCIVTEGKESNE